MKRTVEKMLADSIMQATPATPVVREIGGLGETAFTIPDALAEGIRPTLAEFEQVGIEPADADEILKSQGLE